MSKLRQTAAGGGKLLRYFPHIVKCRGKTAASAPTANRNNLLAGGLARGVVFGVFALAVVPFILAAPAYAADDGGNAISLGVWPVVNLDKESDTYYAIPGYFPMAVVATSNLYGFNLTMQADNPDLVNSANPAYKISSMTNTVPSQLSDNQWGYQWDPRVGRWLNCSRYNRDEYIKIPSHSDASTILSIPAEYVKRGNGIYYRNKCGKDVQLAWVDNTHHKYRYRFPMLFAAKIDPNKIIAGKYSTHITYTVTMNYAPPIAKPKPQVVDPTVCRSGDPKNDCQVDIDPNMIPVKYTGTTTNAQWTSLAKPEDAAHQGEWYNYNQKQWANAVTVKSEALSKYKNQTKVVDQDDILGFWVYIPRYAYEVMRRDGTDKSVPAQDFLISFEKKTTLKRRPAACSTTGRDYRTQCDLNRDYIKGQPSNQGTWATHPAFTFGKKELNGIWFAKFETTGIAKHPTVLPNQAHISGLYSGINGIGSVYSLSKTLGIKDPRNVGGRPARAPQNNHHLAKFSSHMVNNNDWGAATYLSASKYGAGYNGVQINANGAKRNSDIKSWGTTGCGPWEKGNTDSYGNNNDSRVKHKVSIGSIGTQQACSTDNLQRAYNGTLGQLASTTNNPTGIYDMSGGGWEYVAASYSDNLNNSNTSGFGQVAHPPYVNTYNVKGFNACIYQTCGGQALYETYYNDPSSTGSNNMWLNQVDSFVKQDSNRWFVRGGFYRMGSHAGLFNALALGGNGNIYSAFRVALAPAPHD